MANTPGMPDERFQKLKEENERRRKKREDDERRRKQDDEVKAKEALERRRLERLEQDERMRKPWQQPPEPRKPILRKGAKQKPVKLPPAASDPARQSQSDEKRKEWRQGLQQYIQQQRQQAVKAPSSEGPGANPGMPTVPLTWQELKVAAEAGFDELLRDQEEEAAQQEEQGFPSRAARHRSPYKSPFKGAPAPPQETVQVKLVPVQMPASPLSPQWPAQQAQPPPPQQQPSHHSVSNGVGTSYKFSDAPWPGTASHEMGTSAGTGHGPQPAYGGVLAAAQPSREWSNPDGDWGVDGSAASSGGLRRGVTAAARYRPLPQDPLAAEGSSSAGGAAAGRPEGGVGYGCSSPSRQMMPHEHQQQYHHHHQQQQQPAYTPAHLASVDTAPQHLSSPRSYHTGAPSAGVGGAARGAPGPQHLPAATDDPLEASLLAGGALGQQACGLRLTSPRTQPSWQQQQPWNEPLQAAAHPAQPQPEWSSHSQQSPHQHHQQEQVESPYRGDAANQQQHEQQQQRLQRRGWGPAAALPPPPVPAVGASVSAAAHSIAVGDSGCGGDWQAPEPEVAAECAAQQLREQVIAAAPAAPAVPPALGPPKARSSMAVDRSGDLVMFASCVDSDADGSSTSASPAKAPSVSPEQQQRPRSAAPRPPLAPVQAANAAAAGGPDNGSSSAAAAAANTASMMAPSARPPLPNGFHAVPPPPVTAVPPGSTAVAQPPPPRTQPQPPFRAPSPPGSPPRGGTPQRSHSHRHLTVLAASPPPPLQCPQPDPEPPPEPESSGTASNAADFGAERSAAFEPPVPASPSRLRGSVTTTLASPSRLNPQQQQQWQASHAAEPLPSWMGLAAAVGQLPEQPLISTAAGDSVASQPALTAGGAPPPRQPEAETRASTTKQWPLQEESEVARATSGLPVSPPPAAPAAPPPAAPAAPRLAVPAAPQPPLMVPAQYLPTVAPAPHVDAAALPQPLAAPAPQPITAPAPQPITAPAKQPLAGAALASSPPLGEISRPSTPLVPEEDVHASGFDDDTEQGVFGATASSAGGRPGSSPYGTSVLTGSHVSAAKSGSRPSSAAYSSSHLLGDSAASFDFRLRPPGSRAGTGGSNTLDKAGSSTADADAPAASAKAAPAPTAPVAAVMPSHTHSLTPAGTAAAVVRHRLDDEDEWLPGVAANGSCDAHAGLEVLQGPTRGSGGDAGGSYGAKVQQGKALAAARAGPNSMQVVGAPAPLPQAQQGGGVAEMYSESEDAALDEEASDRCRDGVEAIAASAARHSGVGTINASPAALAALGLGQPRSPQSARAAAQQPPQAPSAIAPVHEQAPLPVPTHYAAMSPVAAGNHVPVQQLHQHRQVTDAMAPLAAAALQPAGRPSEPVPVQQPAVAAHVTAVAPEPDMDDLMREIQQLSALRRALKAEFESMGHGEAVAGLQTLSANFVEGPTAAAAPSACGAERDGGVAGEAEGAALDEAAQPQHPEPLQPQRQALLPPAAASAAPAAVGGWMQHSPGATGLCEDASDEAPVPRAPLMQWHIPGPGMAGPASAQPAARTPGPGTQPTQQPQHQHQPQPQQQQQSPSGGEMRWAQQPQHQHQAAQPAVQRGSPAGPLEQARAPAMPAAPQGALPTQQQPAAAPLEQSFVFAPPSSTAPPPPAAAPSPPHQPGLQWTIPGQPQPGQPQPGAAAATAAPAMNDGSTPMAGQWPQAHVRLESSQSSQEPPFAPAGQNSGYATALANKAQQQQRQGSTGRIRPKAAGEPAAGSGGGAAVMAAAERPLFNDGSYVQAAMQAKERAAREQAAKEAIQAEQAAAKAAATARIKAERAAAAPAAWGGAAPDAPLGPKAPSSIGSYSQPQKPPPPAAHHHHVVPHADGRPPLRSISTGRSTTPTSAPASSAATPAAGAMRAAPLSAPITPDIGQAASRTSAWGTPTAPRSNIPAVPPQPPAGRQAEGAAAPTKPGNGYAQAAARIGQEGSLDDSFGSDDFAQLERALESSPERDEAAAGRPRRRQAFGEPAAAAEAQRDARLAGARPQPLHIPPSGASTPMGASARPISTASTVASHSVPTGGRGGMGPAAATGAARGRGALPPKPGTPFTQAIRDLMGLPGSAPLEQAKLGRLFDARGQPAAGLSADEDKLLQSLQRLDAEILKKGLMAAGILPDGVEAGPTHAHGGPRSKAQQGASSGGKGRGGPGAKGHTPAAGQAHGPGLRDSVQQDQLRESLDRLDGRLFALKQKMEDRACMLGMPSMTYAAGAGTPTTAAAAMPPRHSSTGRDATPGREDRRAAATGGAAGASASKSRTPTPNKAKALRDQRQQQLSAGQGPVPPPAKPPPAHAGPPKPASAPAGPVEGYTMAAAAAGGAGGGGYVAGYAGGGAYQAPPHPLAPAEVMAGPGVQQQHHQPMLPPKAPPASGTMLKPPASAPSLAQARQPHLAGPVPAGTGLHGVVQPTMSAAVGMSPLQPGAQQLGGMLQPPGGMAFQHFGGPGAAPPLGMHAGAQQQQQQQQAFAHLAQPPPFQHPALQQQQQQHQQQQQQQVMYVPMMMPNGQMAYVPQYVGAMGQQAVPQPVYAQPLPNHHHQQQHQLQQPPVLHGYGMHMGMGMPMAGGMNPSYNGAPGMMMAWAEQPVAHQQQHHVGGLPVQREPSLALSPSLYSFGYGEQQQGQQQPPPQIPQPPSPQQQQQLQHFGYTPPPLGPMPQYHSTVMRQRSVGSRDGEAAAAAAATLQSVGMLPGNGSNSSSGGGGGGGPSTAQGRSAAGAVDGVIKAVNLGLLLS